MRPAAPPAHARTPAPCAVCVRGAPLAAGASAPPPRVSAAGHPRRAGGGCPPQPRAHRRAARAAAAGCAVGGGWPRRRAGCGRAVGGPPAGAVRPDRWSGGFDGVPPRPRRTVVLFLWVWRRRRCGGGRPRGGRRRALPSARRRRCGSSLGGRGWAGGPRLCRLFPGRVWWLPRATDCRRTRRRADAASACVAPAPCQAVQATVRCLCLDKCSLEPSALAQPWRQRFMLGRVCGCRSAPQPKPLHARRTRREVLSVRAAFAELCWGGPQSAVVTSRHWPAVKVQAAASRRDTDDGKRLQTATKLP